VKFGIEKTGIYKITYKDLEKLGFDPLKVSLFGYGGEILPENFSEVYPIGKYVDDLPQISIWRGNDYILFYGKGVTKWTYHEDEKPDISRFIHENNPYSTKGYYFITDGLETKETQTIPYHNKADIELRKYDDYFLHENEKVSVNRSGRELFGEYINRNGLQVNISGLDGITEDDCLVEFRAIAKATANRKINLSIDNAWICEGNIEESASYTTAVAVNPIGKWIGEKKNSIKMNLSLEGTSNTNSYLDYIRLNFKRSLSMRNQSFLFFRNIAATGKSARYVLEDADKNTLIFEVSDGPDIKRVETKAEGNLISFSVPPGTHISEYVAVQPERSIPQINIKECEKLENQNLHGLNTCNMVIISPDALREEADRLAEFHRNEGLKVEVVNPFHIYNEFSSGTPDATAYRRFLKMLYDRNGSDENRIRHLLLFGDGAYDNRFLTSAWSSVSQKSNYLITYQTQESLNGYSYVVDDYFGFLGDYTGADISQDDLELGIGRFPVTTVKNAREMVTKVINYSTAKGKWKNRVAFIADDGNNADGHDTKHQYLANVLADVVGKNDPDYIVNKIFFDDYPRTVTSGSGYQGVTDKMMELLEEGLFVINYVGHGDTRSWSDEKVLTQNMITGFEYENLPIWITATCDFCRFDDASISAGESVFLNPESGGIALFTTSRVAYREPNEQINRYMIDSIFSGKKDSKLTLGDIVKSTKKTYKKWATKIPTAHLGFCLIGDPAIKLNYPENLIELNSINEEILGEDTITLKARQSITMKGVVKKPSGEVDAGFNGIVDLMMMDNKGQYETRGNNSSPDMDRRIKYEEYKFPVFKSLLAKVENGHFRYDFTMPVKILYSDKNCGKMSLYAYDPDTERDASGSYLEYNVQGTAEEYEEDSDAPEIRILYLNDITFQSGDKVNATPYFVAKVWDKSGIDISGTSVGQGVFLSIDNKPYTTYTLNNYYTPVFENKGEGIVQFSIPALTPGIHSGEFFVSDIMGNSSKKTFDFEVVEKLKPDLYEISASPIPAKEYVEFKLFHNRPKTKLQVSVYVYDITGRLVWNGRSDGSSDLYEDFTIRWDLLDLSNNRVKPGVYIYQAGIVANESKETTKAEKLIILGP